MVRPLLLVPLALLVAGLVLLPLGLVRQAQSKPDWFHVGEPSVALVGDDVVVAYRTYSPESAVYVTRLDADLTPVFRDALGSPTFGISLYPRGPVVKTDVNGTLHLVWTLNDARSSDPDCLLSLHYSRLSPEGRLLVGDEALGYEVGATSCGQLTPSWTVGEDGYPVILDLQGTNETPAATEAPDGTRWVVRDVDREEQRGRTIQRYSHIALYRQEPFDSLEKVAVLASDDPAHPVTLPEERTTLLLTAVGAVLVPVGAGGLLLALRREDPEGFRRLTAWARTHRLRLMAAAGIVLVAASGVMPWFLGRPPPDLLAPFRSAVSLFEILGLVALTPLATPVAALLLLLRSHRLLRSLCLGLVAMDIPLWFLGCCFKGAPGLDAGSGVALAGLLLTYGAAGQLRGEAPLVPAPWPLQIAASAAATGLGLFFLFPLRSIPLLALGLGLLAGGLSYLVTPAVEVLRGARPPGDEG